MLRSNGSEKQPDQYTVQSLEYGDSDWCIKEEMGKLIKK